MTPSHYAYVLRGFANDFGVAGSQYAALCQVLRDAAGTLERSERNVSDAIKRLDGLPLLIKAGEDVSDELDRIKRCLDYALGAPVRVPDFNAPATAAPSCVIDGDTIPVIGRPCLECED